MSDALELTPAGPKSNRPLRFIVTVVLFTLFATLIGVGLTVAGYIAFGFPFKGGSNGAYAAMALLAYGIWKFGDDEVLWRALLSDRKLTRNFGIAADLSYFFGYFTISHWYFGHTLGKWIFGLKVEHKGSDLGLLHSFGRTLAFLLSGQGTFGLGFLFALFRRDGRALHDIVADTVVAKKSPPTTESPTQSKAA